MMDPKLRQCILTLLSATHDGEIAAARNAMLRVGAAHWLDIHELADLMEKVEQPVPPVPPEPEPSFWEKARRCKEHNEFRGGLSDKEYKFVCDMVAWRKPTDRQVAWLDSIYARVRRW
jgi:hypothetical protein